MIAGINPLLILAEQSKAGLRQITKAKSPSKVRLALE